MRLNKIKSQSSELTLAKVRLIARLKSDGSIYVGGRRKTNYFIRYESNNSKELQQFAADLKEVYGLESHFVKHRSGKKLNKFLVVAYVRSKLAFEDMQKYGPFSSDKWRIPETIKCASLKIQVEFLRTFAEDEGSPIPRSKEVRIYSINRIGIEEISKLLENFGIETRTGSGYGSRRNVYAAIIRGKKNLLLFRKFIKFRSQRKNEKLEKLISLG